MNNEGFQKRLHTLTGSETEDSTGSKSNIELINKLQESREWDRTKLTTSDKNSPALTENVMGLLQLNSTMEGFIRWIIINYREIWFD